MLINENVLLISNLKQQFLPLSVLVCLSPFIHLGISSQFILIKKGISNYEHECINLNFEYYLTLFICVRHYNVKRITISSEDF